MRLQIRRGAACDNAALVVSLFHQEQQFMDRLDEWRVFVAVASRRSFIAAARALGRSPQAVTRAVAALEARLGARLLNRTTRAVSLTSDGEQTLERARRALAEFDILEVPIDAERPLAGRLAVTA